MLTLPLELSMTREWIETMCNVCKIQEDKLKTLPEFDPDRYAFPLLPDEVYEDFVNTDYELVDCKDEVTQIGQFCIDRQRLELSVKLLPAIYPHHIVGIDQEGRVVNISICGQSGRSGITIQDAKSLCEDIGLVDGLILDNGNDVFARYEGKNPIAHKNNSRQTRLTAALHFAELLDPGPEGLCDVQAGEIQVTRVRSTT